MNLSRTRRNGRPSAAAAVAVAAVLSAALLTSSGAATAHGGPPAVPAPPAAPTKADQIQNIDQVRTAIKAYYGDTPTPGTDPVTGNPTTLHFASPTGAYAEEMATLEARAESYLKHPRHRHHQARSSAKKAIVLDVDDTTLNTYDYEIYSNFAYNPTTNAAFVNSAAFPAVFGMPALVSYAQAKHYTLFFLTGRPETQRPGTTANLANVGYPAVPADQLYLKDQTKPYLASCAPACTTVQYKSLTRKYIESQGYDIVANFGDQYSDLAGGYADKSFKLPNPMYFLP